MGDLLGPPSGRDLNKMKLVALLALVGFAAASIEAPGEGTRVPSPMTSPWKSNTEYTYEYQGRLLTGIPELSSTHFSGIGIKCTLNVVVTHKHPPLSCWTSHSLCT